jgi:UDP-N-acetylglucosamine 2-epimerase
MKSYAVLSDSGTISEESSYIINFLQPEHCDEVEHSEAMKKASKDDGRINLKRIHAGFNTIGKPKKRS